MDYTTIINLIFEWGSILLFVVAALATVTTIIVEVITGLFPRVPTNFVAVGVALVITILALLILCTVLEISVMWHYAVGALILGIFVGYVAMFGFDKFKAAFDKLKVHKTQ